MSIQNSPPRRANIIKSQSFFSPFFLHKEFKLDGEFFFDDLELGVPMQCLPGEMVIEFMGIQDVTSPL